MLIYLSGHIVYNSSNYGKITTDKMYEIYRWLFKLNIYRLADELMILIESLIVFSFAISQ